MGVVFWNNNNNNNSNQSLVRYKVVYPFFRRGNSNKLALAIHIVTITG